MAAPRASEVPLTGGWKLVLARREGQTYVRLRTSVRGEWSFATPALPVAGQELVGLAESGRPYPVKLPCGGPDAELNLLADKGRLFVHFGRGQQSGTVKDLRQALDLLS